MPTGIDGPQWVLEYWSQLNNVFDFVRVEDIAYDKRPGMGNVVYIVDSGRGPAVDGHPADTRFRSTNGRVWKMVLDPDDPTKVTSFSLSRSRVTTPGQDLQRGPPAGQHRDDPDRPPADRGPGIEPAVRAADQGLDERDHGASVVRPVLGDRPQIVVKIDQSADGDVGYDVDGRTDGAWGAWETTGIVDASAAFGPGAFLINVQAHTLWVEKEARSGHLHRPRRADPDFTFKREGGQLLLIRIPGI